MRRSMRWFAWLAAALLAVVATSRPAGGQPPRHSSTQDAGTPVPAIATEEGAAVHASAVDVDLAAAREETEWSGSLDLAIALRDAYASRLSGLQEIREALKNGERLDAEQLDSLLHDPRDQEELSIEFERAYLAARERRLEAEALDRERRAARRAEAEARVAAAETEEARAAAAEAEAAAGDEEPRTIEAFARLDVEAVRQARYPITLANLLFEHGEFDLARAGYEIARAPEGVLDVDWAIYRAAVCLERAGELEEAEVAYGSFLTEYPESRWADVATLARRAIALERSIASDRAASAASASTEEGEAR